MTLAILATYRVAQLISIDDGPLSVFDRIRVAGGVYDRDQQGRPRGEIGRWLACPYCNGLWLAIVFAVLALIAQPWSDAILIALGIAGGQAWLQGPRKAK